MHSALRPRDIQARIRSGDSPEEVAQAAQTTVEDIMPFAVPVLAERAYVAQTALGSSLRRASSGQGSPRTLAEAAALYREQQHLHEEDLEWDAWRQADGRWRLVATYSTHGQPRRAEFIHDVRGRYVVAENDDARHLTGELAAAPAAGPGEPGGTQRRLIAVPFDQADPARPASMTGTGDDELPLGDDAIAMVNEQPTRPIIERSAGGPSASSAEEETADLSDSMAPLRESASCEEPTRATTAATLPAGAPDAPDWIGVGPAEVPYAPGHPGDDPESPRADGTDDAGGSDDSSRRESDVDPAQQALPGTVPASTARTSRRKGRASVPSWDEIMFGGGSESDD